MDVKVILVATTSPSYLGKYIILQFKGGYSSHPTPMPNTHPYQNKKYPKLSLFPVIQMPPLRNKLLSSIVIRVLLVFIQNDVVNQFPTFS